MGMREKGYLVVQVLNVLLYRINKLSLVLLYRATNLYEASFSKKDSQ